MADSSSSVPQEQVELGRVLMKLNTRIPAFVAKIVPGQVLPDEWKGLAELFKALARPMRAAGRRDRDG